jgi:putative selenium metabolism hydrolase
MEDFLKELVRTPSLSGEEDKIAGLVSDKLNELGYAFEVDGMGNLIAHRGNGKGRTILFDGHLDHVQPGDPEGWAYGPYKAEVIDGVLYGRATVDMKGALAAMIYGCAAPEVEGSVVIAFVVHEETNEGVATKRIIEKKGLKINACILGEPTDLRLSIGQRGRCVFKIITRGSTSHASMPELGVNALYKMAPIIIEIEKVNETLPTHMFLGKGSMSVTTISCQPGVGPIIPDKCEIQVDRRIIPQETLMEVLQEMKRVSPGAEVELLVDELRCYTGFSTEAEQYFPGWITDREHWVVKESLIALKEGISRIPEIVGWKFSTDGVATAGKLGIPTVGFGPGDPSLAHQPNEHIFLDDVFEASKGYCALAYKLST